MRMTGYENLSQTQLYGLFSSETWNSLSFGERINACQEVENRYATEHNVEPCNVTHQQMDGAAYGWQSGQTICLNTYLVCDGCFNVTYCNENGVSQTAQIPAMAPSWNTLDTVYHEGTHGIQEATGNMPSTYISPDMDGDLYRIQSIEKEAYAIGQSRTLNALNEVENSYGKLDASRNDYFASIKNDSFQAALQDAAKHYNDPNIESTLQSVLNDRENGIVSDNPSESYQLISTLCDNYVIHSSVDVKNVRNVTSYGFSPDATGYIDDGSSSFSNESSTLIVQTDSYDDGLSDIYSGISSESSLYSDNDMSDGIE